MNPILQDRIEDHGQGDLLIGKSPLLLQLELESQTAIYQNNNIQGQNPGKKPRIPKPNHGHHKSPKNFIW